MTDTNDNGGPAFPFAWKEGSKSPLCCRGGHLCRDCYKKLRNWSYARALAEIGSLTADNLRAIQDRVKELERPVRKGGIHGGPPFDAMLAERKREQPK